MDKVNKAVAYFILSRNNLLNSNIKSKNIFLNELINVQKDEFSEEFNKQTKRNMIYEGTLKYKGIMFPLEIYNSDFLDYGVSLLYLKINIDVEISCDYLANMINSDNLINDGIVDNLKFEEIFNQFKIKINEIEDIYLFLQLIDVKPTFPNEYEAGIDYIKKYEQRFHQILLRSDTHHEHLRLENHMNNFDSISNFYGSIDLCSPVALVQIYQHPINSVSANKNVYDVNHRAYWWLVLIDMIIVQKSSLKKIIKTINKINDIENKDAVVLMHNLEKSLIHMQEYWHFEDFTHEITKKVVNVIKERLGVERTLDNVLERIKTLEGTVLREMNEQQNEYNFLLNIILFIIAIIQLVPLVYEILSTISSTQIINSIIIIRWIKSFILSISFPLVIFIVRKIVENRRRTYEIE